MINRRVVFLLLFVASLVVGSHFYTVFAQSSLLTPEETLWLKSRKNTIVVYPEKNFPPFSYQSTSGDTQGLSIDYIELLAEKVGATVVYLPSRPLSQILDEVKNGKGDIVTSLADTSEREDYLLFTDSYINVPAVIVTRKDFTTNKNSTLNDFSGKKVVVADGRAIGGFIRQNYPRVVIESVTDDEIALQQVVLGEVDAAAMDVATLSYYLSKQALNSVKIVGNTGFEYKLAFGISKNKPLLQSILDKGLSQISTSDRQLLADKWVSISGAKSDTSLVAKAQDLLGTPMLYALFIVGFIAIVTVVVRRRRSPSFRSFRKSRAIEDLQEKMEELEESDSVLAEEMGQIKELEKKIASKIEEIKK